MIPKRPTPELLLQSDAEPGSIASFPALRLEQNGQKFYFITAPKEDVFPFCFVADRYEEPEKGFQRALDVGRAKDIARYLDDSMGSIPTNIVLSAQGDAELAYDGKKKLLRFRRIPKAFLVLDGQHRLYGYGLTKKKHRVPVSIYEGLTKKEEVALFIDINTTQRGVPAALLLDIKQLAERETHLEQQLRELFDYVATQPDSPLNGLMSPSLATKGKLARPAFNRAVAPVLKVAVMDQLPREKRFELFKNYLRAFEDSLRDPKLLRSSAYLESFCALFEDVCRMSREKHSNLKLDSLKAVMRPLRALDLGHISSGGRARLTKNAIVPVLKETLFGELHIDSDMV